VSISITKKKEEIRTRCAGPTSTPRRRGGTDVRPLAPGEKACNLKQVQGGKKRKKKKGNGRFRMATGRERAEGSQRKAPVPRQVKDKGMRGRGGD